MAGEGKRAGVLRAEPVLREARVCCVLASLHGIDVAEVGGDPAAELRVVARMTVAGDDPLDAGHPGEHVESRAVAAERVGPVPVGTVQVGRSQIE